MYMYKQNGKSGEQQVSIFKSELYKYMLPKLNAAIYSMVLYPYDSGAFVLASVGSFGPINALQPTTASSLVKTITNDGPLKIH